MVEHTWTDDDRLTREDFEAGVPCRGGGRPVYTDDVGLLSAEHVAAMNYTPGQAEAIGAEDEAFKRLHPECTEGRWAISGGGIHHCFRCCAPHPLNDDEHEPVAVMLAYA